MGSRSSLTLYGDKPEAHRMLADHLCSEYRVRVEAKNTGRAVDEWKQRPERPDNHWLDCITGCCVAASMQGVSLEETADRSATDRPKRVSFAELQKAAQQRRQQPRA